MVRKNGHSLMHALQQRHAAPGACSRNAVDRRAEAEPAGQGDAALAPGKAPGDGAQVLDAAVGFARGRARADVELRDFGDRRRGEEIVGEARRLVDHRAIGGHAVDRERRGRVEKLLRRHLRFRQQRGLQARGHQRFQIAAADLGICVFARNDLALFGQADLSLHGAGRLGQDRLVARAAAAAHHAAAAMEQAQRDSGVFGEHLGQRRRGAVELPGTGEEPAVLVAVRIAQHDVLLAAGIDDETPRCRAGA